MDGIYPVWNGNEEESTRKRRRSSIAASTVYDSTLPSKKSRNKVLNYPSTIQAPSLTTLPTVVTRKLLKYLDVEALECLSKTCFYFDQFIAGKFLLSIDFPFHADMNAEVARSDKLEKKPLLKIRCKKTNGDMDSSTNLVPYQIEQISLHNIITMNFSYILDYMVHYQLSLLSLDKLRELDLVPEGISRREGGNRIPDSKTVQTYELFDFRLLCQISRMGSLENVSRLDVLVDGRYSFLHHFLTKLPSLIELGLHIIERTGISNYAYIYDDLRCFQEIVAACKAPVLKLTMVKETRRKLNKVLKNNFVQKLVVEGPCTMNLVLDMENLKEVVVKLDESPQHNKCTYWRSKQGDRDQHRVGLCCVNIGKLYQTCPNLEKYMGVEVGSVNKETFVKWNSEMKKKFYQQYIGQGGTLELKPWVKSRWFTKMPDIKPAVGLPLW